MKITPGIDESKSVSAQGQSSRTPWNKGLKEHACKNPDTCYHKIKPAGMKRPGQSEAMKRVYAEKLVLVEVRRQQMAERLRVVLMNRAKIMVVGIRLLAYLRPLS